MMRAARKAASVKPRNTWQTIQESQRRVDLAREHLQRLDSQDVRFEASLAEYQAALTARKEAERM